MTFSTAMKITGHRRWLIVVLISLILISIVPADTGQNAMPKRFMSRSVKYITPAEAIRFLSQLKLGTASQLPNTQSILVTAGPEELAMARILLDLVDNPTQYVVVSLPADQAMIDAAVHEQFAAGSTDIIVGNFQYPPTGSDKPRVLTDILGQSLVLIAPADQIDPILDELQSIIDQNADNSVAVGEVQINSDDQVTTENVSTPVPEDDNFLNKLLTSLEEAEQAGAELDIADDTPVAPETLPQQPKQDYFTNEKITDNYPEPIYSEPAIDESQQVSEPQEEEPLTKTINVGPRDTQPGFAKRSYDLTPTELADAEIELQLPETVNVTELIDLVGKHLDLDLLYDPAEVKGAVTLRVQDKIKVRELYPLLESTLKFRGFVMTRKGNLVTIVPTAKALEFDPL